MPWIGWVLSGIGLIMTAFSLTLAYRLAANNRRITRQQESLATHDEIADLKRRLGLVEMKVEMFFRLVEERLSGALKQ